MALVIGNSAYTAQPKLPACEASANLVASVLSRAGFKVTRYSNPSNARLGTAISSLGDEAAAMPGGRALIYYCGYAVSYQDRLFLVPVEARLERDADVLSQGIVARLLMSSAAGPGSGAGLVLMDTAPVPGSPPLAFDSMLRLSDASHGGLGAASLPPPEGTGPAPLATALADLVGSGGGLEAGAALAGIRTQERWSRAMLAVRQPAEPSWLLGGPAPAAPPAGNGRLQGPAAAAGQPAPAPAPAQPPGPPEMAVPNAGERRRIQLALRELGYFRGQVNGTFGPDTLAAVRQFQKDYGVPATGRLTVQQAEKLLQ